MLFFNSLAPRSFSIPELCLNHNYEIHQGRNKDILVRILDTQLAASLASLRAGETQFTGQEGLIDANEASLDEISIGHGYCHLEAD